MISVVKFFQEIVLFIKNETIVERIWNLSVTRGAQKMAMQRYKNWNIRLYEPRLSQLSGPGKISKHLKTELGKLDNILRFLRCLNLCASTPFPFNSWNKNDLQLRLFCVFSLGNWNSKKKNKNNSVVSMADSGTLDSILEQNGGPIMGHFVFAFYFALAIFAARFFLDKFLFRVRLVDSVSIINACLKMRYRGD